MNATPAVTLLGRLVVVALFLAGGQSYAQTFTDPSQSFSNLGSATVPFNFATFNSSLGTLDSVEVILENVTLTGSASGTNTGSGLENIAIFLTGTIDVESVDSIDVNLTTDSPHFSQTGVPASPAPGSTITHTFTGVAGSPGNNNQTISSPPSSNVSGYVGNGVTTVVVNVVPSFFGGGGVATEDGTDNSEAGSFSGTATAGGTVDIIYTYSPVPEPTQTAAWMIGFAACVMVGRKYFPRRTAVRVD